MLQTWNKGPWFLFDTDPDSGGGDGGGETDGGDLGDGDTGDVEQLRSDLAKARERLSFVNNESQTRRHEIKELKQTISDLQEQLADNSSEETVKTLQKQLTKLTGDLETAQGRVAEFELSSAVSKASASLNLKFQSADARGDAVAHLQTLLDDPNSYTEEQITDALKKVYEQRAYYFVPSEDTDFDGSKKGSRNKIIVTEEEEEDVARTFGIQGVTS